MLKTFAVSALLILQAADGSLGPLASLGVGGAIAALVFFFYRVDRQSSEKKYEELLCKHEELASSFKQIVQENTASNVKLIALIDQKLSGAGK